MKTFLCVLFYLELAVLVNCEIKLVSEALRQITHTVNVRSSDNFDFIVHGSETENLFDIVDEVVNTIETPLNVRVVEEGEKQVEIHQSSIFLFDTLKSYKYLESHSGLVKIENSFGFNFVVYIENCSHKDRSKLVPKLKSSLKPKRFFRHASFLLHREHDNKTLDLITFETFQQPDCRNWRSVEVNTFTNTTKAWKSEEFFVEKFNNFNGCELILEVRLPQPLMFMVLTFYNDSVTKHSILGYGTELCDVIKKTLNFNVYFNLNFVIDIENETVINDFEFSSRPIRQGYGYNEQIVTSRIAMKDDIVLASRSPPYTQFDKIFLPFDEEVWHWLIATLVISVVVIVVVTFMPKKIRDFVFGRQVQTPILNLIVASLGGGQFLLPTRNFARYLLMMYILFCLVMRTGWQGVQFEFMFKEMRPRDVENIQEMIDRNFTFYCEFHKIKLYQEMELFENANFLDTGITTDNNHESDTINALLIDGSNRGLILNTHTLRNFESGGISNTRTAAVQEHVVADFEKTVNPIQATRLDEIIISDFWGFVFKQNHYMFKPMNRKLVQMMESGVTDRIVNELKKKRSAEDDSLTVLTMEHLGIWFLISLCFYFVSFLSFIGEHLSVFVVAKFKKMV